MRPVCECGCGEFLPEGSLRKYKRGHKRRAIEAENAELAGVDQESPGVDSISPINRLLGLKDSVEDDPAGNTFGKVFKPKPTPKGITPNVRKDVEGKVAFMLITTANAVQLIDPICGGVLARQTAEIAEKVTPILCQSSAVVEWFSKGTSLIMYVELLMALAPVAMTFYSHHLSKATESVPEVPFDNSYYGVR